MPSKQDINKKLSTSTHAPRTPVPPQHPKAPPIATPAPEPKNKLDPASLRRNRPVRVEEEDEHQAPVPVSAGAVDKVVDLMFNPTRDSIRAVTIIDKMQGRLFPQLDMLNELMHYCIEVATFRQNSDLYKRLYKKPRPIPPDVVDNLLFRTAQWSKSIGGRNLERGTDIALAETEAHAGEDDSMGNDTDAWKE